MIRNGFLISIFALTSGPMAASGHAWAALAEAESRQGTRDFQQLAAFPPARMNNAGDTTNRVGAALGLPISPVAVRPVPVGRDVRDLNAPERQALADWTRAHSQSPSDYVSDAIRRHSLVILGEMHGNKQFLDFVAANLGRFYEAGLRVLALEVIAKENDDRVARLVESPTFDRGLQLDIARSCSWLTWNVQEQWNLLEAVWRLNQNLPAGAKLRIAGLEDGKIVFPYLLYLEKNVPMDPQEKGEALKTQERTMQRDVFMADELSRLVDSGARTLAIVGLHHTFTHYRQTLSDNDGNVIRQGYRMGNILLDRHQDKVFHIALHFRHPNADQNHQALMSDFIETTAKDASMSSAGFDMRGTPLGDLRDDGSDYFHNIPMYAMGDMADGYLFLGPLKDQPRVTRMRNFVTPDTFKRWKKYFEVLMERELSSVDELNEILLDQQGPP